MSEKGLVLGKRSVLAGMTEVGGMQTLALDADRDRCLALLSVACRRSVSADILRPIAAAADHWRRGDKALANLRLIFAVLPQLEEPADAYRLRLAEYLLDEGVAPDALMTELGLDPSAVAKYSPDEPRVPAGYGRESGRWTDSLFPASSLGNDGRIVVAENDDHHDDEKTKDERRAAGQYVPEAAGPFDPLDGLPAGYGYGANAPPPTRLPAADWAARRRERSMLELRLTFETKAIS